MKPEDTKLEGPGEFYPNMGKMHEVKESRKGKRKSKRHGRRKGKR